jgi:hypothetical protein
VEASGGRRLTERRRRGWMATEAEGANAEDGATTSRVPMAGELTRPAAEMQRGSVLRCWLAAAGAPTGEGWGGAARRSPEEKGGGGGLVCWSWRRG